MAKRRRLLVGNWKMNGQVTSGVSLARMLAVKTAEHAPLSFDIVLCPPATLIWPVAEVISGSSLILGAQDCHPAAEGAYTGDISAGMLVDLGCRYVIIGHSERRGGHNESDELIARKLEAAQRAGLTVILCIGESEAQHAAKETATVIERQVKSVLAGKVKLSALVVAYEPIWAIGTGKVPKPKDVVKVNKLIRDTLGEAGETMQILYGGSVTPGKCRQPDRA